MIALTIVCSIVNISIYFTTRCSAENGNKLYFFNWSVRSMGRVSDILEKALEYIWNDGSIFLNEDFTMVIFSELHD